MSVLTTTSKVLLSAFLLALVGIGAAAGSGSIGFTTQQAQTAAPTSVNLTGTSSTEGSSLAFARADHSHGVNTTQIYGTAHTWTQPQTFTPAVGAGEIPQTAVIARGSLDDGTAGPGPGGQFTGADSNNSGNSGANGLNTTGGADGSGNGPGAGILAVGGMNKTFGVPPSGYGGQFVGGNGQFKGFSGGPGIQVNGGHPGLTSDGIHGVDTGFGGPAGAVITGGGDDSLNGAGPGTVSTGGADLGGGSGPGILGIGGPNSGLGGSCGNGGNFVGGTWATATGTGCVGVTGVGGATSAGAKFVGGSGGGLSLGGGVGGEGVNGLGGQGGPGAVFKGGDGLTAAPGSGPGVQSTGGNLNSGSSTATAGPGGKFTGGTKEVGAASSACSYGDGIQATSGSQFGGSNPCTGTSTGWAITLSQLNTTKAHEHANLLSADPSSLSDGDRWYQGATTQEAVKYRLNGVTGTVCLTGNGTGTGCESKRGVAGCTTAASVGATCTTTVTWTTAFANNLYYVSCMGVGAAAGAPILQTTTARTTSNVTVQTIALTAVAAQFTTIECFAIHD